MKALVLSEYKQLDLVDMAKASTRRGRTFSFAFWRVASAEATCMDTTEARDGVFHLIVMGHEAAGIIEAVGGAVDWFSVPANTLRSTPPSFAAKCFYCRRGQVNLCDRREVIGVSTLRFPPDRCIC
jgi:L-iditol 2-dehydrogenase